MKALAQVFASACLSLALIVGVSFTFTGCSADSLSGPDIEAHARGGGETSGNGGTTGGGSDHNTDKARFGGETSGGGGTTGTGSDHNTDG